MFGTGKRERTPLSPSPSPEPQQDAERTASRAAQRGDGSGSAQAHTGSAVAIEASGSAGVPGNGNGVMDSPLTDPAQEAARRMLEDRIRIAVDDLMQLATCAAEVHEGDEVIVQLKINETMESLQALQDATNLPDLRHMVPEDVLNMIDTGRNPDIHTRTFTNRLNSDNQQMRGQALSFDRYRGRLRDKLEQAFPEMQPELETLDRTGR